MKNMRDVKASVARYKLFNEKPAIPFVAYIEQGMEGGSFFSTASSSKEPEFKPLILKRSPSIKP